MMTTPFDDTSRPSCRKGNTAVIVIICVVVALVLTFFVVLICGGVLVGLTLPAVDAARDAARRAQSQNNMKQIAIALHNYHDTHGTFPPAYIADEEGRPMHSWRVLLLPHILEPELYRRYDFDKPWDHPDNMAVARQMPQVYASPFPSHDFSNDNRTPYLAISAPDTVLGEDQGASFPQIIDGTSNTIMAIDHHTGQVDWTEPTDISPAEIFASYPQMMEHPQGGVNLMISDGSVRFFPSDTPPSQLEGGFYINDGRSLGP